MKLPPEHAFVDLSDYARPVALRVVAFLLERPVGVLSVTSSFLVVGILAATLITVDSHAAWIAAALLVQIKNVLDAVDGALARARRTPSRLGRFYDSFCDFLVGAAIFAVIGVRLMPTLGGGAFILAAAGLVSALLQGTIYSYFSVAHRLAVGGDRTSRTDERSAGAGGQDWRLRVMYAAYLLVYAWQDRLIAAIDGQLIDHPLPRGFLTAASALGLGSQLLALCVFLIAGWPDGYLWFTLLPANAYAIFLLRWRRARHSTR